jgi:hypothetical protein
MGAHKNPMPQSNEGAETTPKDVQHPAYYEALADRLETLLRDMQARGTPSDDALLLRLADLLSETRRYMRKALR